MKRLLLTMGVFFMGIFQAKAALQVGDAAPDFTAQAVQSTDSKEMKTFDVHLKDLVGTAPIVLYFYPKDNTPGCTKEACSLRDDFAAFRKLNASVFGISYDSIESHKKFIEKHALPFALIADRDHKIAKLYGADSLIFAKRQTFLVDKAGKLAYINPSVDPSKNSAELQSALSALNQ